MNRFRGECRVIRGPGPIYRPDPGVNFEAPAGPKHKARSGSQGATPGRRCWPKGTGCRPRAFVIEKMDALGWGRGGTKRRQSLQFIAFPGKSPTTRFLGCLSLAHFHGSLCRPPGRHGRYLLSVLANSLYWSLNLYFKTLPETLMGRASITSSSLGIL